MASAAINNALAIVIDIDADATAGLNFTVPRAGVVEDFSVAAAATSGGGTVVLSKAGSAIATAVACAADGVVARAAAAWSVANATFTAGQSIRVVTNGAADRGRVLVTFVPAGEALTAV